MSKPYRPSNGTEGEWFIESHCHNCIRGKYEHTGDIKDNPCDIITRSWCCELNDPLYPREWIYDEKGEPTCTAWVKWTWGRDDDGNWIDPPQVPPDDPNQLCMPFIFDELNIKQHETQAAGNI